MTWFRPLIESDMTNPVLLKKLIGASYDIEFTPDLIYLLVEGRLKRAYERNVK